MSGNASDPSTWAPPGESASDLWQERSNFVSVGLSCIAYGVHLTLYLFVVYHLIRYPTNSGSAFRGGGLASRRARVSWGFVAYVNWLFILGTLGIAGEIRFNQLDFVDYRNYPGGPNAFVAQHFDNYANILGTIAYVILNWFADGLVIYRFWLIFNFNRWVVIVPVVMLLGSVSMGIILLYQITQPNANLWTTMTVSFGIPYWTISASLNILVTLLIVLRLLHIRAFTRSSLSKSHAKTYTSIAAMLVESAALYSITALFFVITYALNSNIQNLILPVLGQVQAISPLLIMWRVANGQAISRSGMSSLSSTSTSSRFPAAPPPPVASVNGGTESASFSKLPLHKSTYSGATDTVGTGTDYLGDIGSNAASPSSRDGVLSVSIPLPSLSMQHGDGDLESGIYGYVDTPAEKRARDYGEGGWEMKSQMRDKLSGEVKEAGLKPGQNAIPRTERGLNSPPNRPYMQVPARRPGQGVAVTVEVEQWDSDSEIGRNAVDYPKAAAALGANAF